MSWLSQLHMHRMCCITPNAYCRRQLTKQSTFKALHNIYVQRCFTGQHLFAQLPVGEHHFQISSAHQLLP